MNYEYNDSLHSAGRNSKLWIVHRGQIHTFGNKAMPGLVAVTSTAYQKNGKWSNTTYQLELAENATPCYMLAPMHGQVWPENDRMAAYERFMREFAVTLSFETFNTALLRDYPRSHARMLEGEKALESLDAEQSEGAELVEISTGKSANRNPHSDVRVTVADGRSWVVAYEAQKGTEIPGVCKLVDKKHSPGHRGGTTTLIFAVSSGVTISGEYYEKDGQTHSWALGREGDGTPPPQEKAEVLTKVVEQQQLGNGNSAMADALRKAGALS